MVSYTIERQSWIQIVLHNQFHSDWEFQRVICTVKEDAPYLRINRAIRRDDSGPLEILSHGVYYMREGGVFTTSETWRGVYSSL